jgi:hypothetical protein
MVLLASDFDKSKYLRAEDLKQPTKFRIKSVTEEVFEKDGKAEKKLVVWFTTIEQGLPLNKTNNRTIRGAFGDPVAGWKNKVIVVFPTHTDMKGKLVPCLRVRIPPPKQPQAAAVPQQPAPSGNGAAALAAVIAAVPPAPSAPSAPVAGAAADPELEPDPVKPIDDDLDDEITF